MNARVGGESVITSARFTRHASRHHCVRDGRTARRRERENVRATLAAKLNGALRPSLAPTLGRNAAGTFVPTPRAVVFST